MEKGQGNKSDAEWNREMDEMVDLVKFTKDKDIFKEFYINQLAKRLLSGKSASNEDEIKMVKKLQNGKSGGIGGTCADASQNSERSLRPEMP
jgi:cullin-4